MKANKFKESAYGRGFNVLCPGKILLIRSFIQQILRNVIPCRGSRTRKGLEIGEDMAVSRRKRGHYGQMRLGLKTVRRNLRALSKELMQYCIF